MTPKIETEPDTSDLVLALVGTIFLTVALLLLIGVAFTWLFNMFVVPVFFPDMPPLSIQNGTGLWLTIWLTTVAVRGGRNAKVTVSK